jgi:hypothetical protein
MEAYISNIDIDSTIYPIVSSTLGFCMILYLISSIYNVEGECDRVIKHLSIVVKGEIKSLNETKDNNNPYDLFTSIYPTLRGMDNDRIDEFVTIIQNYNDNWILNDE